ncbi:MAG: aromatic ring-hydroxylating dioxygenase subunit alpha [Pseudomonadota bacterium]
MYPFEDGQTFPKNQWYIAACSHEVGRSLLERTLLDERLVFYRKEDGTAVALDGICPHRNLPLAQGVLDGDAVRCGYHGFRFEPDGRCTDIPGQSAVPVSFCTRSYPVLERWQWIWVWMGDRAKADPALLPDMQAAGLDVPGWRADSNGVFALKARFSLLIDNLMDLSHISYLHLKTIGRMERATIPAEMSEVDGRVHVIRRMSGQLPDGFHRFLHPTCDGPIDLTIRSDFLGPGLINAGGPYSVMTATGAPVGRLNFVHGLTPETAHTTHYFPAVSRDFRLDDEALTQALLAQERAVLAEDVAGLELVEKVVQRSGDTRRELSVLADAGALRVRRRLIEMMKVESR